MSDTLADLASFLPSDFLSGHRPPYDFASTSSTESESDDDDVIFPGLTRRFTRSVSLQERPKNTYPVVEKKRVFSGSPESTLNWNASGGYGGCGGYGPTNFRSSQTTSFGQVEEETLDLIYAAAGHVARLKMNNINNMNNNINNMNNINNQNGAVLGNRGLLGAPRPVGPSLSQQSQNRMVLSEKEAFLRQLLLRERVSGGPLGFGGQSAWGLYSGETQRRQQPGHGFVVKPTPSTNGGCGRGIAVKKGCAGTGVFLPRNYSNATPEMMKKPVCSGGQQAARVAQSFNNTNHTIPNKPQPNITTNMFTRQNQVPPLQNHQLELILAHRQNALILAQQRRNSNHSSSISTPEPKIRQSEVVLPQEWTY